MSLKHDMPDEEIKPDSKSKRAYELPELMHNLDLLVNMSEDEILQNGRR